MIVRGWASTPDLDWVRDVVIPSAFDKSIARRGIGGPKGVKLLWNHRQDMPLGRVLKLETRRKGNTKALWIEAEVSEAISWGRDIAAAIHANGGFSFSIGYVIKDADIGEDAEGVPYLILKELDLHEVSVVVFPCNDEAVMTDREEPEPDPYATLANILATFTEELRNDA